VSRARRTGKPLSVAYIDIDGFKEINDRMGHHEGDRVLREVSSILRTTRDTDLACRSGGDEFVLSF
jgi:diguanylate cyclase (GGDEF)-like protein